MGTKLKLAAGFLGASHAGISYEPNARGLIDVEAPEAIQVFTAAPFNFTVASIDDEDDGPADSFEGMTKSELVDWLVDRGVEIPTGKLRKVALIELCEEFEAGNKGGAEDAEEDDQEEGE